SPGASTSSSTEHLSSVPGLAANEAAGPVSSSVCAGSTRLRDDHGIGPVYSIQKSMASARGRFVMWPPSPRNSMTSSCALATVDHDGSPGALGSPVRANATQYSLI